ncbi:hypothetical protein GMMP1_300024 [Candidatus Magnetomoraceae bacterium gMMP-1]
MNNNIRLFIYNFIIVIIFFSFFNGLVEARTRLLLIAPNTDNFVTLVNENQRREFLNRIDSYVSALNIKDGFINFIPKFDIKMISGKIKHRAIYKHIKDQFKYLVPGDTLLIYINSHGFLPRNKQDVYIIASDTTITNTRKKIDFNNLNENSLNGYVPREEIIKIIRGDKANRREKDKISGISCFLFLDSCFGHHKKQQGGARRYIPPTNFYYGVSESITLSTIDGSYFSRAIKQYSENIIRFDVKPKQISLIDFIKGVANISEKEFNTYFYIPKERDITEKYNNLIVWNLGKKLFVNLWEIREASETKSELRNPKIYIKYENGIEKRFNGYDNAIEFFNQAITTPIRLKIFFPNSQIINKNLQYKDDHGNIFKVNQKGELYLEDIKLEPSSRPYKDWNLGVPIMSAKEQIYSNTTSTIIPTSINKPRFMEISKRPKYKDTTDSFITKKSVIKSTSQTSSPLKLCKVEQDKVKLEQWKPSDYGIIYKATPYELKQKDIAEKRISTFKHFAENEGQVELAVNTPDDKFVYTIFLNKIVGACSNDECYSWDLVVYNKSNRSEYQRISLGRVYEVGRPRISHIQYFEDDDADNNKTNLVLPLFDQYYDKTIKIVIGLDDSNWRVYPWEFSGILAVKLIKTYEKKWLCIITYNNILFYDISKNDVNLSLPDYKQSFDSGLRNFNGRTFNIENIGDNLYSIFIKNQILYIEFNKKTGAPSYHIQHTDVKELTKTPTSVSSDGKNSTYLFYKDKIENDGKIIFKLYNEYYNYINKIKRQQPEDHIIMTKDHNSDNHKVKMFIKRIGTFPDFYVYTIYKTSEKAGGTYRMDKYLYEYDNDMDKFVEYPECYKNLGKIDLEDVHFHKRYLMYNIISNGNINDIKIIKID